MLKKLSFRHLVYLHTVVPWCVTSLLHPPGCVFSRVCPDDSLEDQCEANDSGDSDKHSDQWATLIPVLALECTFLFLLRIEPPFFIRSWEEWRGCIHLLSILLPIGSEFLAMPEHLPEELLRWIVFLPQLRLLVRLDRIPILKVIIIKAIRVLESRRR